MPRRSMIGWTSSEADSIVKARLSGQSSVISASSRPPTGRYPSTMKVNSTGAGGHL